MTAVGGPPVPTCSAFDSDAIPASDPSISSFFRRCFDAAGLICNRGHYGFGEIGLLLGTSRTATVCAKTSVKVICVGREQFFQCFDRFPEFGRMMSLVLAQRLSGTLTKIPHMDSDAETPSADVINLLPQPFLQRFRILPLMVEDNLLSLGFIDEPSSEIIERVKQFLPSLEIKICSISTAFFNQSMQNVSGLREQTQESESEEQNDMPKKLKIEMTQDGTN